MLGSATWLCNLAPYQPADTIASRRQRSLHSTHRTIEGERLERGTMLPALYRTAILVLAVVFATSLGVLPVQSTWAAQSLTVNTTSDLAPPCRVAALSLRCAITTANAA